MRKILTFAAALVMAALAWAGGPTTVPAQKKAPVKKVAARPMVAKPAIVAARRGIIKKAPVVRTTWRTRQSAPTTDRYKEIQDALVSKGYLSSEEANGTWGTASAEALKKFQAEQTLETTGKIGSLSLIALGLGPKHDYSPVPRVVDGNLQPESGRN
jgi:peptidoglycan hydrolase-like protein with peptidoglycan-binding domain